MKKLLLAFSFLAVALTASAQLDSVLWEPFDIDQTADYGLFPLGDDLGWVNFDEDGINPSTLDDVDRQWFYTESFVQLDTNTNYCLGSLSYMEDFAEGNRNWLILPPIDVTSADFTMHWKSAPLQVFRYMDGYTVLASKATNNAEDFTDTLFLAAQMTGILGTGDVQVVDSFEFSSGYIHANACQDSTYWTYWSETDSSTYRGILEPHSLSLAQYAGQKVYLAILHNSDDDYYISVDDILVAKGSSVAVKDEFEKNLRFVAYPNPADVFLNVLFRTEKTTESALLEVFTTDGKLAMAKNAGRLAAGEQSFSVPTSRLPAGQYVVRLTLDDRSVSHPFIVR